jgi:2-polyprenyl-3-methyl-5-hydroxy-6-metoxy-1,4-benzoquinol methylase
MNKKIKISLNLNTQFNEKEYLLANPDVVKAISAGQFKSGQEHYTIYGKTERRVWGDLLTREGKAMSEIDKNGVGLEIGPSHRPIASKKQGYNVQIVDHLDKNGLIKKYANHNLNIDNIEKVDFIWTGQPLSQLIEKKSYYDWIIASHVIEHIPDPISFFQECETLLKPDGKISLIIPDKRYCFDCLNSVSSTGELLDAYAEKRITPSPGQVFNHFANAAEREKKGAWEKNYRGEIELIHSLAQTKELWNRACKNVEYIDVHCWRFMPTSFALFIEDIRYLGLTGLSIIRDFDTVGCEFYVTLAKHQNTIQPLHQRNTILSNMLLMSCVDA